MGPAPVVARYQYHQKNESGRRAVKWRDCGLSPACLLAALNFPKPIAVAIADVSGLP